jgi:hypothetical protein
LSAGLPFVPGFNGPLTTGYMLPTGGTYVDGVAVLVADV